MGLPNNNKDNKITGNDNKKVTFKIKRRVSHPELTRKTLCLAFSIFEFIRV